MFWRNALKNIRYFLNYIHKEMNEKNQAIA